MIFSEADHIQQIIKGTKTQTRRESDRYEVGKIYSIQSKRTAKGIFEGRIGILAKQTEFTGSDISELNAETKLKKEPNNKDLEWICWRLGSWIPEVERLEKR